MQENLKAKYGITTEELKRATDQIKFGQIACDGITLCALVDLVANGDIGAGNTAKSKLAFINTAHEKFYNEQLPKCRDNDCYYRSLIYALGISEDIRNHFAQVYDIKMGLIKWGVIKNDWVTGSDARILRLAFNLYNQGVREKGSLTKYTVSELFDFGSYSKYMLFAIALRYEIV